MDAESKRRVEELSAEGWSQRAIAEQVGVSRGAVWRALRPTGQQSGEAEVDDELGESIGLVGGLLVIGVVLAVVLISAWLDSRHPRPPRHALVERQHRPPPRDEPPFRASG